MGAKGAVEIIFRGGQERPVKLAPARPSTRSVCQPVCGRARGFIDDVICRIETRKRICRSLVMLRDKKLENVAQAWKHPAQEEQEPRRSHMFTKILIANRGGSDHFPEWGQTVQRAADVSMKSPAADRAAGFVTRLNTIARGELRECFTKILIANRGEIAVPVINRQENGHQDRRCHSDADKEARHVKLADEAVHIGAAPSRESLSAGRQDH